MVFSHGSWQVMFVLSSPLQPLTAGAQCLPVPVGLVMAENVIAR